MRSLRIFGVMVSVVALSAIGLASASAAEFTASNTGTLHGTNGGSNQVFTTNAGTLTCTTATTTGTVSSLQTTEQHATVHYSGCTGPFGVKADVTPATYLFTSNGEVQIKEPITITVTGGFLGTCHITVSVQTVKAVDYATTGSKILVTSTVSNIGYTTTAGICQSGGNNGTYTGINEVGLVGGSLKFDP